MRSEASGQSCVWAGLELAYWHGLESGIFRREDEKKFVVRRRVAPRICPCRCDRTEGERQESREEPGGDSEDPSQASTLRETRLFRFVRDVIHVDSSKFSKYFGISLRPASR